MGSVTWLRFSGTGSARRRGRLLLSVTCRFLFSARSGGEYDETSAEQGVPAGAGVRTPVADTGTGRVHQGRVAQGLSPSASTTAAAVRASVSVMSPAVSFGSMPSVPSGSFISWSSATTKRRPA